MSFIELVNAIARSTGVPRGTVKSVLRGFIDETAQTLGQGERVVLPGFGVFVSHEPKVRELFGGARTVNPKARVRFRQSRRSL